MDSRGHPLLLFLGERTHLAIADSLTFAHRMVVASRRQQVRWRWRWREGVVRARMTTEK